MFNGKRELYIHIEPGLEHSIGEEGLLLMRKYFDKFIGRKPLEGLWWLFFNLIIYFICLIFINLKKFENYLLKIVNSDY